MAGRRRKGGLIMRGWIVGALLLLAGCDALPPPRQTVSAQDLNVTQGAVIYGIAESGAQPLPNGNLAGVNVYLIAYNPATNRRSDKSVYDISTGGGMLMDSAVKAGGTAYRFLKLPPGDYAIGWARDALMPEQTGQDFLLVNGTLSTTRQQFLNGAQVQLGQTLSETAQLLNLTPRFHVNAGELAYVGDLHFDVGHRFELRWTLEQNEQAARSFVASASAEIATKMIVRPMTRADGTPIGTPDRVGRARPASPS
jgi:hypothetical protein